MCLIYASSGSRKAINNVETYRLRGSGYSSIVGTGRTTGDTVLFEGYDYLGNKTFKDEYKSRTKRKTFDKTKGELVLKGTHLRLTALDP